MQLANIYNACQFISRIPLEQNMEEGCIEGCKTKVGRKYVCLPLYIVGKDFSDEKNEIIFVPRKNNICNLKVQYNDHQLYSNLYKEYS
jgi:hypothetical protein